MCYKRINVPSAKKMKLITFDLILQNFNDSHYLCQNTLNIKLKRLIIRSH